MGGFRISLDEMAIPGLGIVDMTACTTEIRVVTPELYEKYFPDLSKKKPIGGASTTAMIVVIRQRRKGVWFEIPCFVSGRSGDLLLQGIIGGTNEPSLASDLMEQILTAEKLFDSGLSWSKKHSTIFHLNIYDKARDLGIEVEWYDPDSSYADDVNAFMKVVVEIKEAVQVLLGSKYYWGRDEKDR